MFYKENKTWIDKIIIFKFLKNLQIRNLSSVLYILSMYELNIIDMLEILFVMPLFGIIKQNYV